MDQRISFQAIDAMIMASFAPLGFCEKAKFYTDARMINCNVMVSRGITLVGALGQAITNQTAITAFLAEIECLPKVGSRFEIGRECFTVDSVSEADESRVICIVKVGP